MSEPLSIFKADFLHYESTEEPTEMRAKAIWYRNASFTATSVIIYLYSRGFYIKGTLNHVSYVESKSRQNQFVSAGLLRNVFQLEFQNEFVLVIFHETVELRIEAMLFSFTRHSIASCKTFNQYLKTLISDKFCTEEKLNTFFVELNISPPWVKNPETFKLMNPPKLYMDKLTEDPNMFEQNIPEIDSKTVSSDIIKNDNENSEEVSKTKSNMTEENERASNVSKKKSNNKSYEQNKNKMITDNSSSLAHPMGTTERTKGDHRNLYRKHRIIDSSTLPNKNSQTRESLNSSKKYLSLRSRSTPEQSMVSAGSTPDLWENSETINENTYDEYKKTIDYSLNRPRTGSDYIDYNKNYLHVNNAKTIDRKMVSASSIPDLSRNPERTNWNQRQIYETNLTNADHFIDPSNVSEKSTHIIETMDNRNNYLHVKTITIVDQVMASSRSTPDLSDTSVRTDRNQRNIHEKNITITDNSPNFRNSTNRVLQIKELGKNDIQSLHDPNLMTTDHQALATVISTQDISGSNEREIRNLRGTCDTNIVITDYSTNYPNSLNRFRINSEIVGDNRKQLHSRSISSPNQPRSFMSSTPDLRDNCEIFDRDHRNIYGRHATKYECPIHSCHSCHSSHSMWRSLEARDEVNNKANYLHVNNLNTTVKPIASVSSTPDLTKDPDSINAYHRILYPQMMVAPDDSVDLTSLLNFSSKENKYMKDNRNYSHVKHLMTPSLSLASARSTPDISETSEITITNERVLNNKNRLIEDRSKDATNSFNRSYGNKEQENGNKSYSQVNNLMTPSLSLGSARSTPDLSDTSEITITNERVLNNKNRLIEDRSKDTPNSFNRSDIHKKQENGNKNLLHVNNLMRTERSIGSTSSIPDLTKHSERTYENQNQIYKRNISSTDYSTYLSNSRNKSKTSPQHTGSHQKHANERSSLTRDRPRSTSYYYESSTTADRNTKHFHENQAMDNDQLLDPSNFIHIPETIRKEWDNIQIDLHKKHVSSKRPDSTWHYPRKSKKKHRNTEYYYETNVVDIDPEMGISHFKDIPIKIVEGEDHSVISNTISDNNNNTVNHFPSGRDSLKRTSKGSGKVDENKKNSIEKCTIESDPFINSINSIHNTIDITEKTKDIKTNKLEEKPGKPSTSIEISRESKGKSGYSAKKFSTVPSFDDNDEVFVESKKYTYDPKSSIDIKEKSKEIKINKSEKKPEKPSTPIEIFRETKGKSEHSAKKLKTVSHSESSDKIHIESKRKLYDAKNPKSPKKDNEHAKGILEFPTESSIYPVYLQESIDDMFEESDVDIDNKYNIFEWTECSAKDFNDKSSTLVEMLSPTNENNNNWSLRDSIQRQKSLFDAPDFTRLEWNEKVDRLHYDPIRKNYQIDDNGSLLLYCCRQVPVNEEVVS